MNSTSIPTNNQIYHHYSKWEEYHYKMWEHIDSPELAGIYLQMAIEFTSNVELYGFWMKEVIKLWKYSCEQNLTANNLNQRAWIGHAACCLAIGCPEYITRQAWHYLNGVQQIKANLKADEAIKEWITIRENECQNDQLGFQF